jgi:hypothetical protein
VLLSQSQSAISPEVMLAIYKVITFYMKCFHEIPLYIREASHIDFFHEKRHMFVWGGGGGGGGL